MRHSVSLYIAATLMAVATFMQSSAALPAGKPGLDHGVGVTLGAVTSGVKSIVGGVANPKSYGSKAQAQKYADLAGSNVGDSLGSALKGLI